MNVIAARHQAAKPPEQQTGLRGLHERIQRKVRGGR